MALPFLLGALLQGGALWGADKMARDRMDEARQNVKGLLGTDPTPQQFYGGLLSTPGYEKYGARGLEMLNDPSRSGMNPASVREWEYYNNLPDEQKSQYLTMKRAAPTFTMGDVPMLGDPHAGTARPWMEPQGTPQAPQQPAPTQAQIQQRLAQQEAEKAAMQENVKAASKRGAEAFDQLRAVDEYIANYDDAIRLIDEGAGTGPIMAMLPSFRQASIELDNVANRLGLSRISATTFGNLSNDERAFAVDSEMPRNLQGPALKEWLNKKKEAQQKYRAALMRAATYLGTPGNTTAGYLEMLERGKKEQGATPQGGQQAQPLLTPASQEPSIDDEYLKRRKQLLGY